MLFVLLLGPLWIVTYIYIYFFFVFANACLNDRTSCYFRFCNRDVQIVLKHDCNAIGNTSLQERKDPTFANAIKNGVTWTMVSSVVQEKFPQFASLCQAAGNATQQVAKHEGELQVARKVLMAIVNFKKRTGRSNVTWSEIKDDVLRSKPPNSASLPLVFVFVLRFSGDPAGSCDIFV